MLDADYIESLQQTLLIDEECSDPKENYEKFAELTSKLCIKDPCSPAYATTRKQLGVMAFDKGDLFSAAYNFQESFGPGLRTYVNFICDIKLRKEHNVTTFDLGPGMRSMEDKLLKMDPETTNWDCPLVNYFFKDFKKIVEEGREQDNLKKSDLDPFVFREIMSHKYINSCNVEAMKNYNEQLPCEWTIVQITKGPSVEDRIGPYKTNSLASVPIYITLFSGDNIDIRNHKPVTICINPPDEPGHQYVLSEILAIIDNYNTRKTEGLRPEVYWPELKKLEETLQMLLNELNDWLGGLECLFLGKLKTNNRDYELICKEVDDCIADLSIAEHERILLYRLTTYGTSKSLRLVNEALTNIFPGPKNKEIRMAMQKFFNKNWKSTEAHYKNMEFAERGPVILIVDEYLDKIPWEMLQCLRKQPVCRVHSLHMLHALYFRHKEQIKFGYFEVDKIVGNMVLNAGSNLPKMEIRMKSFMKYWLPSWPSIVGNRPTATQFAELLEKSTIFFYAGHGGGAQYLTSDTLDKKNIKCIAFLSGCSSTTLVKEGITEAFGLHLSYHIAGSPCVLGNLWLVTDTDSDLIISRILSTWIPGPKNSKHFMECNLDNWNSGTIDANKRPSPNPKRRPLIGPFYPEILYEKDLLKVLAISRGNAASIFNTCAMVARGIPVKIKY